MQLKELLKQTRFRINPDQIIDHFVHKISVHSQDSDETAIFVAIEGNTSDGHDYIKEVISKGCLTIIYADPFYQLKTVENVNLIRVEDTKKALAILTSCFYGYPSHQMDITGVTGTNGKTTITSLIHNIYSLLHIPTTLIGTNGIYISDSYQDSPNTTPSSLVINKVLKNSIEEGIHHAILEVSSHSVKEQRVAQLDFNTMIYTNFSLDHLDYHKTYDDYFYNKALPFAYLGNVLNDKVALLNGDDEFSNRFLNFIQVEAYTYGIHHKNDFQARNIEVNLNHLSFDFYDRDRYINHFTTRQLFGFFNVSNLLAALSHFYIKGYDMALIKDRLDQLKIVKGRFEKIETKYPIHIFVDFAHTPKSVFKILKEVKLITKKRIITVLGCGGDRDQSKRPIMGEVATTLSDLTIFTSDNPRNEDEQSIIEAMIKGAVNRNYISLSNRKEAIYYAVNEATSDDIVLILGKGHEQYQLIKGVKTAFDDYETGLEAINTKFIDEQ